MDDLPLIYLRSIIPKIPLATTGSSTQVTLLLNPPNPTHVIPLLTSSKAPCKPILVIHAHPIIFPLWDGATMIIFDSATSMGPSMEGEGEFTHCTRGFTIHQGRGNPLCVESSDQTPHHRKQTLPTNEPNVVAHQRKEEQSHLPLLGKDHHHQENQIPSPTKPTQEIEQQTMTKFPMPKRNFP